MAWFDQITQKFVANVANKYFNDSGLEAFNIFPKVNSAQLTGYIGKYTKADWLRIGNVKDYKRAGATESVGDDYALDKQSYTLEEIAFHKDVSKDDRNEYDNPFDPINDATQFVINRIRRVILQNLVDKYIAGSIWGNNVVGTTDFTKWSTTSTPVDDVLGWKQTVEKTTGFSPNRLIVAPDVHKELKTNADITGKMKTTSDKVVTTGLLARLFEVDTYAVMNAVNSGATDYMIAGKALLVYTPNNPTKFEPSAGYHLTYKNKTGQNVQAERIPMKHLNDALRIEASIKIAPVVLATDLGVYASAVI
jgi:hypothetical protein